MNKNTLFYEETASPPPPLARRPGGGTCPVDSACGAPTQSTSSQRGLLLGGAQILFWYKPFLLQLPTPNSAALPKETYPPTHTLGEGKHKVPTDASGSPRAGNY